MIGPDTQVNPEVAYGIAKYAAGKMAFIECESLQMECIWTRTFSVYGINDNRTTMVMYAIDKLLKGEKPVFTKAEQTWDYLYSKDAARALAAVAEKGRDGAAYSLGSGEVRPLRSYVEEIRDLIRPEGEIGFGEKPYGSGQIMFLGADIGSLVEDTGFQPAYTFKEGLEDMLKRGMED